MQATPTSTSIDLYKNGSSSDTFVFTTAVDTDTSATTFAVGDQVALLFLSGDNPTDCNMGLFLAGDA